MSRRRKETTCKITARVRHGIGVLAQVQRTSTPYSVGYRTQHWSCRVIPAPAESVAALIYLSSYDYSSAICTKTHTNCTALTGGFSAFTTDATRLLSATARWDAKAWEMNVHGGHPWYLPTGTIHRPAPRTFYAASSPQSIILALTTSIRGEKTILCWPTNTHTGSVQYPVQLYTRTIIPPLSLLTTAYVSTGLYGRTRR